MKITRTELSDLCKKIFEGQGFPLGDYEDCAHAVTWLEMHGWPILTQLFQDDSRFSLRPSRPCEIIFESPTEAIIEATNNDGLIYANLALDLAYLKAVQHGRGQVKLQQARYQPLILPSLVTCARRDMNVVVYWQDAQGEHIASIEAHQLYPTYTHYQVTSSLPDSTEDRPLNILCTTTLAEAQTLRPRPHQEVALTYLTPLDFALAFARHNQEGMEVDERVWQEMITLSKQVLVEASEASRRRGAGEAAD